MNDDRDASAAGDESRREELVSQVRVIEEQPLHTRAAAYAALHDELKRALESAPGESRTDR